VFGGEVYDRVRPGKGLFQSIRFTDIRIKATLMIFSAVVFVSNSYGLSNGKKIDYKTNAEKI
jgi:hypothetical protein